MTTSNFKQFADIVEKQYKRLAKGELLVVDVDPDELYSSYLAAFPEGANPIFRERTEHDCSCCRHFIRNIGPVVAVIDGSLVSVWDVKDVPAPYDVVVEKMQEVVRQAKIAGIFLTEESKYGTKTSRTLLEGGELETYDHFEVAINSRHQHASVAAKVGSRNTDVGVFKRGLEELSLASMDAVIDIIETDAAAIYRGVEFLPQLKAFRNLKSQYDELDADGKELFIWSHEPFTFRNTVMGTLITDLSKGEDLEQAVGSFEAKVAPSNYKRPKSLITKGMVDSAMKKIEELGIRDSLERRHAKVSDVSVNDILFVDRSVRTEMKDALEDLLLGQVAQPKVKTGGLMNPEAISIQDFINGVVPKATGIEVMFESRLKPNLVSVTAPVNDGEPRLFSWSNDFSWSYNGGTADSDIKQRVKAAGGNVSATLRVSLSWQNLDDLDIHVQDPRGNHIHFGNRMGKLDIDMNVCRPVRNAVENVCWSDPDPGRYIVHVNNYNIREMSDVGFELELEANGTTTRFSFPYPVNKKTTPFLKFFSDRKGNVSDVTTLNGLEQGESQSDPVWDLNTREMAKVVTIMNSPNHWGDNSSGNEHWFFILDGCKNPDPVRGMYNENLRNELHPHRKVFEVLASKMKAEPSDEQLSGLGFSSTTRNEFVARVTTAESVRSYKVTINQ